PGDCGASDPPAQLSIWQTKPGSQIRHRSRSSGTAVCDETRRQLREQRAFKSRWEDAAEIEEARRRLDTALPRHKDVLIEAESLSCPRHRGRQSQRRRAVRITRDREAGEGDGPHGGSLRALLRELCLQLLGEKV